MIPGQTNNSNVDFCPLGIAMLFVGPAIIHMEGCVLSSGQCNAVSRGEILWTGRRPGGYERLMPMRIMEAATM